MVDERQCLFCRIGRGEIPAKKVYEDDESFAFLDINPRNPGHTLVIPKVHYQTLFDMPYEEARTFFAKVKKVAEMVRNGMQADGISILQSNGQAAGQIVAHVHFHIIPRFLNEGPVSLEGVLQVKKMNDKVLDDIASSIENSTVSARPGRPVQAKASRQKKKKEAAEEEKEEPKEEKEERHKFNSNDNNSDDEEGFHEFNEFDLDDEKF